jgi:hypothetical protein
MNGDKTDGSPKSNNNGTSGTSITSGPNGSNVSSAKSGNSQVKSTNSSNTTNGSPSNVGKTNINNNTVVKGPKVVNGASGSPSSNDTKNVKPTAITTVKPMEYQKGTLTTDELARKVIQGRFGNGLERKRLLGTDYEIIQAKVNEIYRSGN